MSKNKLNKVKSTGFKTPDKYFENFEDQLLSRLNKDNTINEVNEPGFSVPKDYFNSIEDKIFDNLKNEDVPVVKLNSRRNLYYIAGIAASLILLVSIFIGGNSDTEELSAEIVESYLENSDLDSYELAQLLSDANLLEDDFTIITTPYNEDNLEDYLINNTDIETILEY